MNQDPYERWLAEERERLAKENHKNDPRHIKALAKRRKRKRG